MYNICSKFLEQYIMRLIMPVHPEIHYLWIGPPTEFNPMSALPGHDIAGPINFCKELQKSDYKDKNVKFWCFEKHQSYYQELFKKQGIHIEVCSVEKLIEEGKALDDPAAKLISENLANISQAETMSMGDVIDFKDRFSLFLLMKQPGYFLDTNVFPKQGKKLNFPPHEAFTTAQSDLSGLNDFYLMYSPNINLELREAFMRRLSLPYYAAGEMTFHNLSIPYLDLNDLGVEKVSYKSYRGSNLPGFFHLLNLDYEKFTVHCQYTDINQQVPCLFSKRVISNYSLCWLSQNLTPEIIRSLSIPTDYAYIAGFSSGESRRHRIYFYDKKRDEVTLLRSDKDMFTDIYSELFPRHDLSEDLQIDKDTAGRVNRLMRIFSERAPNAHPPVLVNIAGGTLLHHAVMSNDIQKVRWLINMGARLDLKAVYQIQPSDNNNIRYEYTPLELAQFIKLDAIVEILQDHTKQATAAAEASITELQSLSKSQPDELSERSKDVSSTSLHPISNRTKEQIDCSLQNFDGDKNAIQEQLFLDRWAFFSDKITQEQLHQPLTAIGPNQGETPAARHESLKAEARSPR